MYRLAWLWPWLARGPARPGGLARWSGRRALPWIGLVVVMSTIAYGLHGAAASSSPSVEAAAGAATTYREEESVALLGVEGAETLGSGGRLLVRLERRLPVQVSGYRVPPDRLARLVELMGGDVTDAASRGVGPTGSQRTHSGAPPLARRSSTTALMPNGALDGYDAEAPEASNCCIGSCGSLPSRRGGTPPPSSVR
jgi:hypothetical protein